MFRIDVKALSVNELIEDATVTPGAVTSGLLRSSNVGPNEEKLAMVPPTCVPLPNQYSELYAATDTTLSVHAGSLMPYALSPIE